MGFLLYFYWWKCIAIIIDIVLLPSSSFSCNFELSAKHMNNCVDSGKKATALTGHLC